MSGEHVEAAMTDLERSRKRLAADFHAMIGDVNDLLTAVKTGSGAKAAGVRSDVDVALYRARRRVADLRAVGKARARRAAADADLYAHRHPWRLMGYAAATGVAVGALIGIIGARR